MSKVAGCQEKDLFTPSSTALGLRFMAPASGWRKCTTPSRGGAGESCIWRWIRQRRDHRPRRDRSGHRRRHAGGAVARPDRHPDLPIHRNGAYDGKPTFDAVTSYSANAAFVIPPRVNAVDRPDTEPSTQQDRHIAAINTDGWMTWQAVTGYGKRSLVETAIGRYKAIIGRQLRARSFDAQQTEVAIGCIVLNRMLACARPKSTRSEVAAS